jgi:asparagine synthase (glutamine-hydrolysing)
MCGIFLHISKTEKSTERALEDLKKRGPDNQSIVVYKYKDYFVTIGHTRLGIVDVNSSASNQPIVSEGHVLTFNGEIYNYRELGELYFPGKLFKSDSVLLFEFLVRHPEKVLELKGMFAFCFIDLINGSAMIVSDRFGKKPIYYTSVNSEFTVASTLKSIEWITKINKEFISKRALNYYLKYNYTPVDQSIYFDVRKLSGGSLINLDLNSLEYTLEKYYDVSQKSLISNEEIKIDIVYDKLKNAVGRRLVADVPVGIQLSSGVDSTLVAAVSCKDFNTRPEAFTIVYDDPSHSEESGATKIARSLGIRHNLIRMQSRDFKSAVRSYYNIYDEPFADPSAIPTIHLNKVVHKKNFRVLLTGDGGDEFWLGYNRYVNWPRVRDIFKYRRLLKPILHLLRLRALQNLLKIMPQFKKWDLRQFDIRLSQVIKICKQENLISVYDSLLAQSDNQSVLSLDEVQLVFQLNGNEVDVNLMSINDVKNYLQGDILVKNDRASMFYSIETRSPLLDIDLVEEALSTGFIKKISVDEGKKPLRTILNRLLPEYNEMFKKGFGFPIVEWMTEEDFYKLVKEKVNKLKNYSIFNEKELDYKLSQFELYPESCVYSIWNLFLLMKFFEDNEISQISLK